MYAGVAAGLPEEAVSIPREARGGPVGDVRPAEPVWAWIRTYRGVDRRVKAKAIAATGDAVLTEWGSGGVGRRLPRRGCGGLR
ncbi:hypothetical protein EDF51_1132 [Curtobacterium sp. PhB25]|nr:hypothetical protein EDF51_1132 [Curtobacterium sp. PhB25]